MFFTDMHALKIMYIGAPFTGLPWEARLVGRLDKWNKIRFAFLIESVMLPAYKAGHPGR